jgi:16S rRNA (cytosine1402-N4)-methyltransferase
LHVPVLLREVIEALRPRPGGLYLDGTLGAGNYSEAILNASSPTGRVIGLDMDATAVARSSERLSGFGRRFIGLHGGFHQAAGILAVMGIVQLDGAVLDLGLSSDQLEEPSRGFSFMKHGPLDMRFDCSSGDSTIEFLLSISTKKLEEILATYGQERYCRKLAEAIKYAIAGGQLETTSDLVNIVNSTAGSRRGRIHPATRTFQALRIAVNREMENLDRALVEIPEMLGPEGRMCVVSYHSLEDRRVKLSFRERRQDRERWLVVTKKPVRPTDEEKKLNPRSRSAKMRVIESLKGPKKHEHGSCGHGRADEEDFSR